MAYRKTSNGDQWCNPVDSLQLADPHCLVTTSSTPHIEPLQKKSPRRCHGIKGIRIVVLRTQSLPILPSTTPVAPRTPSPTTDAPPVPRSHTHRRPPPFPRRLPAADPRAQKGNPSWSIVKIGNLYLLSQCVMLIWSSIPLARPGLQMCRFPWYAWLSC